MRVAASAAAIYLTVALVGCGGDEGAPTTMATTSTTTSSTTSPRTSSPASRGPSRTPEPSIGTLENPLPKGLPAYTSDGWRIIVKSVQPDATAPVMGYGGEFSPPPAPGNQFYLVTVEVLRMELVPDVFNAVSLDAVGPTGAVYDIRNCGLYPPADTPFGYHEGTENLYKDQMAQVNVCWEVASADAAGLVMYHDPFGPCCISERTYFALHD